MSSAPYENRQDSSSLRVPITLMFVMAAFLVTAWIVYSHVHKDERISASSHQSKIGFAECVSPDLSNFSTCLQQSVESEYDQTKEYYDLKAQQDMAKWALLMFVVTGVGVGYLALTLHTTNATLEEARKATAAADRTVDETKRIGEAQTRGYATANTPVVRPAINGFEFQQEIIVTGQTPLTDVSISVEMTGDNNPDRKISIHRRNYPVFIPGKSHPIDEKIPVLWREIGVSGKVKTVIWYTDVFQVRFRSRQFFGVVVNPSTGKITVGQHLGTFGECFVEVARDGKEHDEDFSGLM